MSRALTSSKLIESVRTRAMLPDDTSVYTDQRILDVLNEQIDTSLLPALLSINEEHLVVSQDNSTSSNNRYKIPYRAIGNKLRDVNYSIGDTVYELSRMSLEELSDYRTNGTNRYQNDVFYLEGDEIVLLSSSRSYSNLKMYFYLRPNVLVREKEVGKITTIDKGTGLITFEKFPENFSNLTEFDFVSNVTPNRILKWDITKTDSDVSTKSIIFDPADIPEGLSVGDYICAKEESPVPNIPTEYHPILAQMAAVHILEALNDTEGLQNATRRLDRMLNSVMKMTDNRVEGAPQKIKQRHTPLMNTFGFLNGRRRRW
jgi:hypothetical protein